MNNIRDISPIQQDELQQGVNVLEARRNKMQMFMVLSSIVSVISFVALIFNQSLVYAFFDISNHVQQLHLPVGAVGIEADIGQNPDYFGRLLSWVMWLGLKTTCALVGASVFVHYAQKVQFFKKRMSNFCKRFLVWVIGFIFIWMGITALQSEMVENSHHNEEYTEFIAYDSHISQSDLYRYLQKNAIDPVTQDYLLAQAALLHQPIDKNAALAYSAKLIQAEKQDPQFVGYGVKPEQLWAIQHQLYGKAVTPLAQSAANKVAQADQIAGYSQWIWIVGLFVSLMLMSIFYALTRQFNQRLTRIENRLQ